MASTFISRTLASNGQKKGTISVWFKVAGLGTQRAIVSSYYDANYHAEILLSSNDQIDVFDYRSGYVSRLLTNRLFRDIGAWYHLVYEFDSTNGVADDRNKLWINGVQETSFSSRTNYGSSASTSWDTDYSFRIGARNSDQYWNGEMSHFYFIQGYNYAASTFGETDSTSGIWKIKTSASVDYDGTGGNSCFLKMEDRTNLDLDSGDNSLTMTTTGNLTATYDNPSNNFVTMNELYNWDTWGSTLTNGNTTILNTTANKGRPATLGIQKGKWYWEVKNVSGGLQTVGIVSESAISDADLNDGDIANGFQGYGGNRALGFCYESGQLVLAASTTTGWGSAVGTGDIVQVAVDLDNSKLYFGINGTWQNSGDPTSGSTGTGAASITSYTGSPPVGEVLWFPLYHSYDTSASSSFNFGNGYFGTAAVSTSESDDAGIGSFEYDVPTGYYALCTKNIKAYGG